MQRRTPITKAETGITTRKATPADLDALERIEALSFTADRFSRRTLRRLLSSASAEIIIAKIGGRVVGQAILLRRRGTKVMRLYSIAVDPAARGRGAAERLLEEATRAAEAAGVDFLRLELRPSNAAAMRLYERAGFAVFGRKPAYYADGEDAIRMERRIPADCGTTRARRLERR